MNSDFTQLLYLAYTQICHNLPDFMAQSPGPSRSYDRSWDEIEEMLEIAEERIYEWQDWFETCREKGDREGMKEAARKYKSLQNVVKSLKWVLGEEGAENPVD